VAYRGPEPLAKSHALDDFDCGGPPLNDWLVRHALASQAAGTARVFVTTEDGEQVVGYYALAAAQVEPVAATERLAKGQPKHRPIPVVLLARLAVDLDHQSRGVGTSLLTDAMLRAHQAADQIGLRAMLVHAKDDRARDWYEQYGFESSPTDPLHLILLMKDLRAFIARASRS
jgi:GNAT superfamily N-acetyltransferase